MSKLTNDQCHVIIIIIINNTLAFYIMISYGKIYLSLIIFERVRRRPRGRLRRWPRRRGRRQAFYKIHTYIRIVEILVHTNNNNNTYVCCVRTYFILYLH